MITRLRTAWSSSAPARTQPVRPFGRPGTLIRYHVGFPDVVRTATRAAPGFGFASTASRLHAIVPDPTTSTCEGLVARAPAPGANATAHAMATAIPAIAPASRLGLITSVISLKVPRSVVEGRPQPPLNHCVAPPLR